MISKKNYDNIEKESDEMNRMDMSDDKDSDEIYQIDKNYEEILTNDIEVLKLGKLGSQKNIDSIKKEYDERNRMDIIDEKGYDERYQMIESKEDDV